jgi:hypothetical protein
MDGSTNSVNKWLRRRIQEIELTTAAIEEGRGEGRKNNSRNKYIMKSNFSGYKNMMLIMKMGSSTSK